MVMRARRQWLGASAALAGGAMLGGLAACRPRGEPGQLPADLKGGWVGADAERGHALRDGRWREQAANPADQGEALRVHTLILGAGVAGLSAARVLMQAGLDDFAILDLEDEAGGNARGHRMQSLPCPLGAHYLPVPGPDAHEVAQWLEEEGLIRHEHGRWVGDERHLCHSPQERVFVPEGEPIAPRTWWAGQWHEGLAPHAAMRRDDQAQFQRFHAEIAKLAASTRFAMPTLRAPWLAAHAALDAITFTQWLDARGYTSPMLRWYVDYACRDDYGAGAARVSAWAGLHYFASRLGAQGGDAGELGEHAEPLLTWPQGNAHLIDLLAHGLGARWRPAQVALRVDEGRDEVAVHAWSARDGRPQRWVARQLIVALPLFVAQRLLSSPLAPLQAVMGQIAYAPWLVSNLLLREPFQDRAGAPLSWDNVPYTGAGTNTGPAGLPPALGYVDARHQSLAPPTGPKLFTHYWALGGQDAKQGDALRHQLMRDDWRTWAGRVAADLARVHPELPAQVVQMDLMRYGHAMCIPVPGLRGHAGLAALQAPIGRLHFAHADLSAYSVFEEAFTHGVRAANQVLSAAGMQRRMA